MGGPLDTWKESCRLCPHRCGAVRGRGERGVCRARAEAWVANTFVHRGEEPAVSGTRGSGTIFFSFCTGRCVYCQNHPISQGELGTPMANPDLAQAILALEKAGCHNVNLVSPTSHLGNIREALREARAGGLSVPVVYNTSGYEEVEVIRELGADVQVYLPDLKYADDAVAEEYSGFRGYWGAATAAIEEMARMAGPLEVDDEGILRRGVLVRHLVLPGDLSGSRKCLAWLSRLAPEIGLSLMSQYHPCYQAAHHPPLDCGLRPDEYQPLVDLAAEMDFALLYAQGLTSPGTYLPDFDREKPFAGTNPG